MTRCRRYIEGWDNRGRKDDQKKQDRGKGESEGVRGRDGRRGESEGGREGGREGDIVGKEIESAPVEGTQQYKNILYLLSDTYTHHTHIHPPHYYCNPGGNLSTEKISLDYRP